MNSKKIVIVDDDELVISALKTLLRLEGFSDANFFTNPLEALEYIKIEKPALILSDFMMGEMNGFEFLSHAKKLHPEISMILLTGYADKENAIRAINEVGLYKYIEKPWDNDDLIMNIRNGIERTDLISQLQQKVEELDCANQKLEKYSHNLEELVAEKTADLLSANSKLSGIFNYSADGIIIINEKTGIESVNPAAENIIGVAKESLIGMSFSNISNYKNKNEFKAALKEEPEILLKDCYILNSLRDKRIPVEINFAFIETDRREDIRHYVGIIRDISVQKETDRLREDFIATLTHDMRTPLMAAIQTLKFFLDGSLGELDEKQTLLLSTMKKSNEDLLGLVNALLEVYRYEAGKLTLCKTDFSITTLINQVYKELEPLAENKNIEFTLNLKDDDVVINADRGEIRRVILNLCANAIKYTNMGGKVEVDLSEQDNDVVFSITDNGNGIPKEDVPNLFKRFSQGTNKKRSTGTGLGLYLSRQIVEAHGGKIWLESRVNKGSQFSFLLTDVKTEKSYAKVK